MSDASFLSLRRYQDPDQIRAQRRASSASHTASGDATTPGPMEDLAKLVAAHDARVAEAVASRSWDAFAAAPAGKVRVYDLTGGPEVRAARRALADEAAKAASVATARLRTGATMPLVGLGTWKAREPGAAKAATAAALRSGYRHVDCAYVYLNEHEVGDAVAEALADGVCRREELFVTGKLWNTAHGDAAAIRAQFEASRRALRLEFLDLYMLHWPVAERGGQPADAMACLAETWKALEALVDEGRVKALGVCNFTARKLERLLALPGLRHPPAVLQVEGHPYLRQDDLIRTAKEHCLAVVAYSPLGSGDRSAAEFRKADEPKLLDDPVVRDVARRLGRTPAQVLIRWAVQRGTATIPKSSNPSRIRQNLDALAWTLPEEDFRALSERPQFRYVCGSTWCGPGKPWSSAAELWDDPVGV